MSWLLPMFSELEKVVQDKEVFTHQSAHARVIHQLAMKW